jgi:O-methyltransferase
MSAVVKYWLTRTGELVSPGMIHNLDSTVNYLEVGRWMRANGYEATRRVARREQLFHMVAAQVAQRDVLYMEFGVYRGATIRYWSKLLQNPSSKLHGFDSFEGLPEAWLPQRPKGHFSVQGQVPRVDDPRIQFFPGWFEQTLPHYRFPAHDVLVLNFDADLYSSPIFALNALEGAIVPGTYIYFDEFNHRLHELRAFGEFSERTHTRFSLLGATRCLAHVLFQRIA